LKTEESNKFVYFIFGIGIFIIYSNTFHVPFIFDDYHNIVNNNNIHIKSFFDLNFKELFFNSSGMKRPLSYFTFSINWLFSKDNVFSYHLVNIIIHCIVVIYLFKSILIFFKTPALKKKNVSENQILFTALSASLLWAFHPIQTQAVTYIVQRMASLAAMFSFISIYYYLLFIVYNKKRDISFAFLFFVLALMSKENAIILILFYFLIEIILNKRRLNLKLIFFFVLSVIFIFNIAYFIFDKNIVDLITTSYKNRPFNVYERLLSQSRIVFFYLSQIFYPTPERFSLIHEFNLSKSLFEPITTFFAAIFWIITIALLFKIRKKFVLLSFGGLFFITGHLIESTIMPLELIFEHRNYLPSAFLFLPVCYYFSKLVVFYKNKTFMYVFLHFFIAFLIFLVGMGTYIRNFTWGSQKNLWEDCVTKSDSMRAWHNLAYYVYEPEKKYAIAQKIYEKALNKKNLEGVSYIGWTYNNLASVSLILKDYRKAEENWLKVLDYKLPHRKAYFNLAKIEVKKGNLEKALEYLNFAIEEAPLILYYNTQALINYHLNEPEKSFKHFLVGVKKEAYRWEPWYYIGNWHTSENNIERGYWFLRNAEDKTGVDLLNLYLYLINNRLKAKDIENAEFYAEKLVKIKSLQDILKKLDSIQLNKIFYFPIEYDEIKRILISKVID
jgi:tetratricopeptide (TPR) repeat protein